MSLLDLMPYLIFSGSLSHSFLLYIQMDEQYMGQLENAGKSPPKKASKKKHDRDNSTLRKAPQAPKRFKSSYICFFMAKQGEIKEELGEGATVSEVSKRSAEIWRSLTAEERAHWNDVAAKDKQRYLLEKATYTGPWQVPWKRARKVWLSLLNRMLSLFNCLSYQTTISILQSFLGSVRPQEADVSFSLLFAR